MLIPDKINGRNSLTKLAYAAQIKKVHNEICTTGQDQFPPNKMDGISEAVSHPK
jgi:hypothetical protein